jgi:hypothetical protein
MTLVSVRGRQNQPVFGQVSLVSVSQRLWVLSPSLALNVFGLVLAGMKLSHYTRLDPVSVDGRRNLVHEFVSSLR